MLFISVLGSVYLHLGLNYQSSDSYKMKRYVCVDILDTDKVHAMDYEIVPLLQEIDI